MESEVLKKHMATMKQKFGGLPSLRKIILPIPTEQPTVIKPAINEIQNKTDDIIYHSYKPKDHKIKSWDITELEKFFTGIKLPTEPIKLNSCTTITDIKKFIENHFSMVEANNGNFYFLPYLNRLQELKKYLSDNLN